MNTKIVIWAIVVMAVAAVAIGSSAGRIEFSNGAKIEESGDGLAINGNINYNAYNISSVRVVNITDGSGEGTGLQFYNARNNSYQGIWYYPDPALPDPQVAITTHTLTFANETHEHLSIYTTDDSYSDRLNRISLDYGKNVSPLELYNVVLDINGLTIREVGQLNLNDTDSSISFVGGEILRLADLTGENNESLKINAGLGADIVFKTRDTGDSLQNHIVMRDGATRYTEYYGYIDMNNNSIRETQFVDFEDNTIGGGTCGSSAEGRIIYDSSNQKHYGCNSTNWVALY